ncbi:hypothetical protein D9M71_714150 [compost metagenome]
MLRYRYRCLIGQSNVFREHPVHTEAQRHLNSRLGNLSGPPVREKGAGYTLTLHLRRYARPDLHNLASTIRQRDHTGFHLTRIATGQDHQIAKVERGRMDPDEDLAMIQLRAGPSWLEPDLYLFRNLVKLISLHTSVTSLKAKLDAVCKFASIRHVVPSTTQHPG